jgi:hypothetical protein
MSKHTGTAKGIATWLRNCRIDDESSFELAALEMNGAQTVASWTRDEVTPDPNEWCGRVDILATQDAEGRGSTTRYELRHVKADRVVGVSMLRRVVVASIDGEGFDGSNPKDIIKQLASAAERAQSQVIEMSRAAMESQRGAMQLLRDAYQLLGAMQVTSLEQHARLLEVEGKQGPTKETDPMVKQLIATFGPGVAAKLGLPPPPASLLAGGDAGTLSDEQLVALGTQLGPERLARVFAMVQQRSGPNGGAS